MVKERERGGWRHRLDRLTPFQNHYCIIWIWMLDLASRLFSKLASPTGCFDLMPLPVARGQSIQMIWCFPVFFFSPWTDCAKGNRINVNDNFRVFANIFEKIRLFYLLFFIFLLVGCFRRLYLKGKFLLLNGNIFILIFVYLCLSNF